MSELPGIVITGASGRMGQMLVKTVLASGKARLVGCVERAGNPMVGRDIGEAMGGAALGVTVTDDPLEAFAKAQAVIDQAKKADKAFVYDLMGKLMVTAPDLIIDLAARYIEVERETSTDLSPVELLDVLEAWWELNDLSAFFTRVWKKIKPLLASQTQTMERHGSNAG